MIRPVYDTNLVVSGLLWSGGPGTALHIAAERRVDVISTEALIDELRDVLKRDKFRRYLERRHKTPEELVADYLCYTTIIEPATIPSDAVRDIDDLKVLAAAIGGRATHIVSGDDDLLSLQSYQNIPILTVRDFIAAVPLGGNPPDSSEHP